MQVPFFRPSISEAEIQEVVACLRSGWLTTGPRTRQFEAAFAAAVGARHALALNSCTAALHLAVEALGLRPGQAVLVPTMTFAATAEVVRYQGAVPLLVDCDPLTLNMDLEDARRKIDDLRAGRTPLDPALEVVGMVPVHVGGLMMDMDAVKEFAAERRLWLVEDAAHAFPAAYRQGAGSRERGAESGEQGAESGKRLPATCSPLPAPWRRCGDDTAAVTCFSFYANKTMTTGEGGMAVAADGELAARMRQMSLHGLSHDAWKRYAGDSAWDYRIVAAGFKYNFTDIAAALGFGQLQRAEQMRCEREAIAAYYRETLGDEAAVELPPCPEDRIHSWHLFPVRLNLDRLTIDRNQFIEEIRRGGVGCSVHWRPLHLHPYYEETFAWRPEQLPVATRQWPRLVSLPLFPGMRREEQEHVVAVVRRVCADRAV